MEIKFEYPLGQAKGIGYAEVPASAIENCAGWEAEDTYAGSETDHDMLIRGTGMEVTEIVFSDPETGKVTEVINSGIEILARPVIKRISDIALADVKGLYMHFDEQDCLTEVATQATLDRGRGTLMDRFGDVLVAIDRDNDMWSDRVVILSGNWRKAHKEFCDRKQQWCDRYGCD